MRMASCHPDVKYHANGMCKACYQQHWSEQNRGKTKAAQRRYKERNPERDKENRRREYLRNIERKKNYHRMRNSQPEGKIYNKNNKLIRRYGIGLEQYNKLILDQSGACAVCGRVDGFGGKGHNLRVDHDHRTNEVRGLLCNRCNTGLGYLENDEWYAKAIEYLRLHDAKRGMPISA